MPPFSAPTDSRFRIHKPVGIDLGTTNSAIAQLDPTDSVPIVGRDERGRRTFPSRVGCHVDPDELVAGRIEEKGAGIVSSVSSVKRFMGLPREFALGPHKLTPPELSACILRLLRDVLADTLRDPRQLLDSAVLTVPAYFTPKQIEATRQAGELAGFEVVELLHEPTAAALYYSWLGHHGDAAYLVYHLGGGTFDASLVRRRLDDCEVLAISGDPFLGGDDFDRLLATELLDKGTWSGEREDERPSPEILHRLFDLITPAGAANFARLVQVAERIKIELTDAERVERYLPDLIRDGEGRRFTLEAVVEREGFHRLIRDKVERTIACCREALAQARQRAGLHLTDIDYIILVGGSSRIPLVRDTVRAAFCNTQRAEHVRCLDPLLHEPDLCVAYGAALRAATHGTRYLFSEAELHLTSSGNIRDTQYLINGIVRLTTDLSSSSIPHSLDGGSVRIRSLATGFAEEVFLDERGTFAQEMELQAETDNALELTVCAGTGQELGHVIVVVRHRDSSRQLGQAAQPAQRITKPLQQAAILSAPPRRPTRADLDSIRQRIGELLPQFSERFRSRLRAQAERIREDLFEALRYDDEPKAIQRMAELRELLQQLETKQGQILDPPWPRFAQLVQYCLDLAAEIAENTGRDREELCEHIRAQERYAEQASEELNQTLYRECYDNLEKYGSYLTQLLRDARPRPRRSPVEEARAEIERFRAYLSAVWKRVREYQRADLEARLTEIAVQARGLSQRIKIEPLAVLRETKRLGTEVEKVAEWLQSERRSTPDDDAGLLEGTSP